MDDKLLNLMREKLAYLETDAERKFKLKKQPRRLGCQRQLNCFIFVGLA
ncbi:MAG: hypothetical protein RIS84_1134 [Pseudomonadota bacterium]